MVEMYVQLVQKVEGWTIDRVPSKYRDEVRIKIEGGNQNG